MKKILLVAAIASTFMAFANGEEVAEGKTVVQEIGITAITTEFQSVIVAFSYKGSDGENLTADKLVKTTNLTEHDELHAYVDRNYKSWVLTKDTPTGPLYWRACTESTVEEAKKEGTGAPNYSQAVGTGIWLKRYETPNGSYTFYIYGTPATSKEITVVKGTTMLIGNPNSTKTSPTITNAAQGDAIYIPNGTAFTKYTYGSNKKWNKGFTELDNPPEFAANTGAWYESKGTENDEDVKILWSGVLTGPTSAE